MTAVALRSVKGTMEIHLSTVLHLVSILTSIECVDFTSNPANQTVVEGRSVRLSCGSSYATSNTCSSYLLSWFYRPSGTSPVSRVADCDEVYTPFNRRSITAGVDRLYYHLDIPDVQPIDSGQYWCNLYFSPGSIHNRVSAMAWLTVNPPLPRFSPSCEVQPQQTSVGTEISLTCTLNENDPISFLTWYEAKTENEQLAISSQKTQPGQTYTIQRVLRPTDNMQEFTCTAGPHTNGPSCNLTPLQIQPHITIAPPYLTLYERDRAVFTCNLEAIPPATPEMFGWMVYLEGSWVDVTPDSPDHQFELSSGRQILEIQQVTVDEFDKARIRCIVLLYGDQYLSANDSFLTVLPSENKSPETGPNDDASQGPSAEGIVGGTIAVVLSLVGIVFLLIYWVKIKRTHPEKAVGNQIEMPGRTNQLHDGTTEPGNSPTYENILLDNEQPPEPQHGTATNENPADTEGVMYSLAGHTGSGRIRRYKVPISTIEKDAESPAVNAHASGPALDNSEQVIYAMPFEDEETPTASGLDADATSCSRASEGDGTTENSKQPPEPQNGTATNENPADTEGVMYSLAGHTGSGRIRRYKVPISTIEKDAESPAVNADASGPAVDNSGQVIYAMPFEDEEMPTASGSDAEAPSGSRASERIGTTESAAAEGEQTMAAGGALYADLDVDDPSGARTRREQEAPPAATYGEIVYAEIHNVP
ncbi:uncharacterized protein LOC119722166 [Patiria miniata]|uniref:Ig-like domain-containing protein n=1 Tax=Patiria miniata TaxID=46514 RepID=A0A913ZAT9_PATMI|nr:uncharacterized protein LOC119722166 [Patiria miniata]